MTSNSLGELTNQELDMVAGGWSQKGFYGATAAGAATGFVTGLIATGNVGGAAEGALLGASLGGMAYNIQGFFEQ